MNGSQTTQVPAYLHADFCFVMDDDSMESACIRAGDIVAFAACSHAEDGQIVAVSTGSAVLLRRVVCDGRMLTTCTTHGKEDVLCLDELPGAEVIGRAVEVRHIFTQEGQQ